MLYTRSALRLTSILGELFGHFKPFWNIFSPYKIVVVYLHCKEFVCGYIILQLHCNAISVNSLVCNCIAMKIDTQNMHSLCIVSNMTVLWISKQSFLEDYPKKEGIILLGFCYFIFIPGSRSRSTFVGTPPDPPVPEALSCLLPPGPAPCFYPHWPWWTLSLKHKNRITVSPAVSHLIC